MLYVKRGTNLGISHALIGSILLLCTIPSAIEYNLGFVMYSFHGFLFIYFGLSCIISARNQNPQNLQKFLLWCKSSIVLTFILAFLMAIQFYYDIFENNVCELGSKYLGSCYGLLLAFTVVPFVACLTGIILFPKSLAQTEDERFLIPTSMIEDLVIPPARDMELNPLRRAVIKFNNFSAKEAIEFLIKEEAIKGTPVEVANFLWMFSDNLNTQKVGDYIGEYKPFNIEVLKYYTDMYDFTNMDFDMAIRHYLGKFRIPGEAQKIDRIMESFAAGYTRCNPHVFPVPDTAYVLAFSVMMLNTDLHSPNIKKKMTLEQFISNNRGIAKGQNLPREFMERIYNNIKREAFKIEGESVFATADKSGYLQKMGRNNRWQTRYFVVSNNCLFYFQHAEDKDPCAIIPLEGLAVLASPDAQNGHPYAFTLYDPTRSTIKSVKLQNSKKPQEGGHSSFLLSADNAGDLEQWIASIKAAMVENPVMVLINQKKLQMEQRNDLEVEL